MKSHKSVKADIEVKPTIIKSGRLSKEEKYIVEQEEKLMKEHVMRVQKQKEEETTRRLEEEKKKLKELHYMRCPKCGMELEEVIFMDMPVDICNECNGIWLDKGEIEAMLAKESGFLGNLCAKIGLKKVKSPVKKSES
ncbi:MAG: zf-TFIIB domain-containing protein [Candidatus Eremiobacterota bacterium]